MILKSYRAVNEEVVFALTDNVSLVIIMLNSMLACDAYIQTGNGLCLYSSFPLLLFLNTHWKLPLNDWIFYP